MKMASYLYYEDQKNNLTFPVCDQNPWGYTNENVKDNFGAPMVDQLLQDMRSETTLRRVSALQAFANFGNEGDLDLNDILYANNEFLQNSLTTAMEYDDDETVKYVCRIISNYSDSDKQGWFEYLVIHDLYHNVFDYFEKAPTDVYSTCSIIDCIGNWAFWACELGHFWQFADDAINLLCKINGQVNTVLYTLIAAREVEVKEGESEAEDYDVAPIIDDSKQRNEDNMADDELEDESEEDDEHDWAYTLERMTWAANCYLTSSCCHDTPTREVTRKFLTLLLYNTNVATKFVYDEILQGTTTNFNLRHMPKSQLQFCLENSLITPIIQGWELKLQVRVLKILLFVCKHWCSRQKYNISEVFTETTWTNLLKATPSDVLAMNEPMIERRLKLSGTVHVMQYYFRATKRIPASGVDYALAILDTNVIGVKTDVLTTLAIIAIKGSDQQRQTLTEANIDSKLRNAVGQYNDKLDDVIKQALQKFRPET